MKRRAIIPEIPQLIEILSEELSDLPDKRTGANRQYQVRDTVMAAFSVFFTQSSSFLEHQRLMKRIKGKLVVLIVVKENIKMEKSPIITKLLHQLLFLLTRQK